MNALAPNTPPAALRGAAVTPLRAVDGRLYARRRALGAATPGAVFCRRLGGNALLDAAPQLAALVLDAVAEGASLGYMAGTPAAVVEADWRALAAAGDGRIVFVAEDPQGLCGVVVLVPAGAAFQRHRAEIAKLVVHRRARRRGVAAALLQRAEAEALRLQRTVLSLRTRAGSDAELLYRRLGWQRVGLLPDDSLRPDGWLCDAALYAKRLHAGAAAGPAGAAAGTRDAQLRAA